MSFPCSMCGLCCQNIGHIESFKEYDRGDGICKYFDFDNNGCKIYENRPDICNIDRMYSKYFYKEYKTLSDFYIANANSCNFLQEKVNFDKSFRIFIKKER